MFVYDWKSHLSKSLPLLWLFTHYESEKVNLAIIRRIDGTFDFYEGEDGKLFPTEATIAEIAECQTGTERILVLVDVTEDPLLSLEKSGDEFMDVRGPFWIMIDPSGYDFEQVDQSMIVMTTRA